MKTDDKKISNYINHIALVLDASSSMDHLADTLVQVADGEIRHLARRSQELDQETRVTIYSFADEFECLVFDKDVLRLPSIRELYRPYGNTALIATTEQAIEDLERTATLYGDHAFLIYVLTDGQENASRYARRYGGEPMQHTGRNRTGYTSPRQGTHTLRYLVEQLSTRITNLPDNWTLATLVPDAQGVMEAKRFGFAPDNIAVWSTTRDGVLEVGETIRTATDTFMTNRALGVRGSKTIFAGGAAQVNTANVRASQGFRPLDKAAYTLLTVANDGVEIRQFVEWHIGEYRKGSAYYELTKPEKIQPQKVIMVRNRRSGRVYSGPDARALLSLPDHEVRVKPEGNPEFQIFVQSTSVNRKLVPNTKLLVLT